MNPYVVKGVPFKVHNGISTALIPIFLDIETSNNQAEDPAELRCWITSIQVLFNNEYKLYRDVDEFIAWLRSLYAKYKLYPSKDLSKRMIVYIHNASYDLSYLIPYLQDLPGESSGIILKPNKYLTYVQGAFEFRCSYLLSGMSLEKWSEEMDIEHKKKVGYYDYDKVIYPDDELTDAEQIYDEYDVRAMEECLNKQLAYHGDDLSTIPYTATGYIRRDLRRSCIGDRYYRDTYFKSTQLSGELYDAMLKSFAGGYTHCSRFVRGQVIPGPIGHRDFKSHYPTQLACSALFPIGTPHVIYDILINDYSFSIEDILDKAPKFATMSIIKMTKATLASKDISMPFLQFSKMYETKLDYCYQDNGRVLSASGEWIMYLDNLTLQILKEQYNLSYTVLKVWEMKAGRLPDCFVKVVDKFFKGKSDKKNLVHELTDLYGELDERTRNAQFDLTQNKKGLNAIYGCCATNPLRNEFYNNGEDYNFGYKVRYDDDTVINEGLTSFYGKRGNFLPYQIGVWTTALARFELYQYICAIGYANCLYCDTDSIFYIKNETTEKSVADLNAEKRATAHFVTLDNGKLEYYDEFSSEPDCAAFKGLHSKCYGVVNEAYVNKKGEHMPRELKLTIAGVPARTLVGMDGDKPVYVTREDELADGESDPIKALDHLNFDTKFHTNTGVCVLYIGAEGYNTLRSPSTIEVNGHKVKTAGGCVIRKVTERLVKETADDVSLFDNDTVIEV